MKRWSVVLLHSVHEATRTPQLFISSLCFELLLVVGHIFCFHFKTTFLPGEHQKEIQSLLRCPPLIPTWLSVTFLSSSSRSQGSHRHRAAQPDEHGQAEHQGPDRVRPQPRPHAGLGLRAAAAVLCGDGALSEARLEKYALAARSNLRQSAVLTEEKKKTGRFSAYKQNLSHNVIVRQISWF